MNEREQMMDKDEWFQARIKEDKAFQALMEELKARKERCLRHIQYGEEDSYEEDFVLVAKILEALVAKPSFQTWGGF